MNYMKSKLSIRSWTVFILIGLIGQLAWAVENMYLNVFLYNAIYPSTSYIAVMVGASAVTATVTTFIMGAVSDRIGRRKAFVSLGYILWGLATAAFGFVDNGIFRSAAAAAMAVVALDCIMTFFGSTANDAAFNAYVTENTLPQERGKVEGVLSTLSLISLLIIFGFFDPLTQRGEWKTFFLIFGLGNVVAGCIAFILIDDSNTQPKDEHVVKGLIRLCTPSEIRSNRERYLVLLTFGSFNIALQVFYPYLIIYIQHYLGITDYALLLGAVLIVASTASIITGRLIDRFGKLRLSMYTSAMMFLGLIGLYLSRSYFTVMLTAMLMMSGYMGAFSALGAKVRDVTPENLTGSFQGIRMIFQVAIPMIIGPAIGNAVIGQSGGTYEELGVVKHIPTPSIFLAAALTLIITFILIIITGKEEKRNA